MSEVAPGEGEEEGVERGAEHPRPSQVSTESVQQTKPRWGIPHRLESMMFVGRDVLAVADDIYIIFINLKTLCEIVYVANSEENGDGLDCIAGHRSNVFAIAEKKSPPRIIVCTYPSFSQITQLRDTDVNRYKGLCMAEGDLIAGFSGFPDYTISVWSWRISQRLFSVPTGVVRRGQIYTPSRTHQLVCQSWDEGLIVWEIAHCYRHSLPMKRVKQSISTTDGEEPKIQDICWTAEGHLYALDPKANLYSVASDGIGMVMKLEWCRSFSGELTPLMCSFGHGFIIFCPDGDLRCLKVVDAQWQVVWESTPVAAVCRLVSNATCDVAVMWTEKGHVYRITGEHEDKLELCFIAYKQRYIEKMQLLAPDCSQVVTINNMAEMCLYDVVTGKLVEVTKVKGQDVRIHSSPVEPLLAVYGEVGYNYGIALFMCEDHMTLQKRSRFCLTNQTVSRVCFSPSGKELVAAAMSAGHIFIMKVTEDYELETVRYAEIGRGLADCFMSQVGPFMRCFSLVIFSDKYKIGERVVCINAETGKDNKFAGKMQGPYFKLLPLGAKDTIMAIPHLSKEFHILKLSGEKGVTVSVKVHKIIVSGHEIKRYRGVFSTAGLLTYGMDGWVILRQPEGPVEHDLKLVASHRYGNGVRHATLDIQRRYMVTLASNKMMMVVYLDEKHPDISEDIHHEVLPDDIIKRAAKVKIMQEDDKNWSDLQEDRRVKEETMDYKTQRGEVVKEFKEIQKKLVALLEENLAEIPLHQLPVSEFNLHLEAKRERLKQAAEEREVIRQQIEARIVAQDKVTAWIKSYCWDTMLTPRVKLCAIFSHYVVENYAVLPTQRDNWPALQLVEYMRSIEMEQDANLFRPWEEKKQIVFEKSSMLKVVPSSINVENKSSKSIESRSQLMIGAGDTVSDESVPASELHVLSGTLAHRYIQVPPFQIHQMLAFSFLQMNWLCDIVKLKSQNIRLWFNKEFDELMSVKKREVGLVEERNRRLRVIIDELNKLSDLRASFHHMMNVIQDPEWRQEEQPSKLIKVEPEEVSIEPYISPSQVVVKPPDPGPKDDFKERALIDMMDGVLEKLWHEEIKKPVPMPACMLEKDPENFNEDDLRLVFDYEAKVKFRNEEREKYRRMLHAEFSKLTAVVNEGIVKFNARVKEMFITKLKVESAIGQENLNLMRLRRVNLDRTEAAEKLEVMRNQIARCESEMETLQSELKLIQEQAAECQAAYEALALKDRLMDKNFKANFADLSPIVVDQCYRMFKRRPKWVQRVSMIPVVLYEMANACITGLRSALLHPDCYDYLRGVDQLDSINNMPPVMDEHLWSTMCKLRRAKIELEIRMRAMCLESSMVEQTTSVWNKALSARKAFLVKTNQLIVQHREQVEFDARNKTVQLVMSAGLVEIPTSGHEEDFSDATLIRREDIEAINALIMKVGQRKLAMMRKHMEFRRGILAKEWEHSQMTMRLRHMEEELYSYERLKIPKELQRYLKNKEKGYTDDQEYVTMEKEMEAAKVSVNKTLYEEIQKTEDLEVKISTINARMSILEQNILSLKLKLSEKRLNTDPMEPIRRNQALKRRMDTLVKRSRLVREVQANHTTIVVLQTQLELLRLKTFPTLSRFRTIC